MCESTWISSGDEMNIHVPQSEQTRAEVKELMMIEKNLITAQNNKPITGILQDGLLGTFKITSKDNFISKEHFMNIMMKLKIPNYKLPKPSVYKPKQLWTGKQVFELILPNINLKKYNSQSFPEDTDSFTINDSQVIIRRGKFISGQLCKKTVGAAEGGIIHITWLDHGSDAANNFISQTQFLVNCWLQQSSFSIGAGDIFADSKSEESVKEIISTSREKVNQIITIGKRNNLDPKTYESKINQVLNNAVSQSGREIEINTTLENNIKTTVTSGSKGSILNIAQIMGCVGQQNVAGKRVALGYTNRVLPHFEQNDIRPAAKGFVENSYKIGLTPYEFYYHAMGGREGVIDTAVKTSESGYIQRRLVKSMEDLKVSADKSLRNSIGDVVQFIYGQDGIDATYLISENIHLWKSEKEFKDRFVERSTPKEEIDLLQQIPDMGFSTSFKSPVHINRLLESIAMKYSTKYDKLSPKFIFENVSELLNKISIYVKPNTLHKKFNEYATLTLKSLLRTLLASKQIRKVHQFTKDAFLELIDNILYEFERSVVPTGEMVGTLSAQSLGQVVTQLTLNSVEWNTPMLFKIDGLLKRVKIGEFIDNRIEVASQENIENHPNNTTLEYVKDSKIEVLACTEEGKIIWDNVEAVTRHPPNNKDGSNTLVKICLHSGREVIATKAKSFLTRKNNKIVDTLGSDLKHGDYIPVSNVFQIDEEISHLDVSKYLSKNEYLYTSETGINYKDNCVYPKHVSKQSSDIPENIELDTEFGFFIGAYLAEGCCTEHHTLISNMDYDFNLRISQFCDRWNLNFHVDEGPRTLRIHSLVLTQLLRKLINTGSGNKQFPSIFLQAPEQFQKGLIDGYFSGDGTVSKKQNEILATSISNQLLQGIQMILTKFHIQSSITKCESAYNAHMPYNIRIGSKDVKQFQNTFTLTIKEKQDRLASKSKCLEYGRLDYIPNVETIEWGCIKISRKNLQSYIDNSKYQEDKEVLLNIQQEDIVYDQIVSIEDIESEHKFVYDLTVTQTKNFNTYDGIAMRDTFHLAGCSAKNVTLGVPRLKEIINVSKNIKSPGMVLPLKSEFNTKEQAECIAAGLEFTKLHDVVKSFRVIQHKSSDYSNLYFDIPCEFDDEFCDLMIQYTLDVSKLKQKHLTVLDVSCKLLKDNLEQIHICHNNENCSEVLLDIHIIKQEDMDSINIDRYIRVLAHKLQHECILQGSSDLSQTYINENNGNYFIETDGSNIDKLMNNSYFDYSKIMTNDIMDVYDTLGIEAARQLLLQELRKVIEFDGSYVNIRHFLTLVDTMTYKGDIMAITRHGINKANTGPLMKCSFEETVDVLTEAAVFSETDSLKGVTENIIVGKMSNIGTGNVDLFMNF